MKLFTKETLIQNFIEIEKRGWIKNTRTGNSGSVGNILEDLLGIESSKKKHNFSNNSISL